MNKQILIKFILLCCAAQIAGCSTAPKEFFPTDGKTMQQIYDDQSGDDIDKLFVNGRHFINKRPATNTERSITPYMNHNLPRPEFKMLQNPIMYLFVNTHLSTTDRIPVPAYVTEFKLLKRDEYAQAGELNLGNWR